MESATRQFLVLRSGKDPTPWLIRAPFPTKMYII
jgi:hypothetical protein